MRFGFAILGVAGVGLMGCADMADPWTQAQTPEECHYEERKSAQLSRVTTAGQQYASASRALSRGIRESQLRACLARVGGDATAVTVEPAYTTPESAKVENRGYRPQAGCSVNSSVMQGGSAYCLK